MRKLLHGLGTIWPRFIDSCAINTSTFSKENYFNFPYEDKIQRRNSIKRTKVSFGYLVIEDMDRESREFFLDEESFKLRMQDIRLSLTHERIIRRDRSQMFILSFVICALVSILLAVYLLKPFMRLTI